MEKNEIAEHIVRNISAGVNPDDIILELCEKEGWSWAEAEQTVRQIQTDHQQSIAKKRFPLLFALAFGIYVIGLGLIGCGVYVILSEITLLQENLRHVHQFMNDIDAFQKMGIIFRVLYDTAATPLYLILIGAGMLFGSLIGLRDAWSAMLFKQE